MVPDPESATEEPAARPVPVRAGRGRRRAVAVLVWLALLPAALAGDHGTPPVQPRPPVAVPPLPPAQAPAVAPSTAEPLPGCLAQRAAGWVGAENARPGVAALVGPDVDGAVGGYLDRTSASCGDTVGVHLGVAPAGATRTVTVAAYRLGWYHGSGARLVWRSGPVDAAAQPIPSGAAAPHLVLPDWPVSVSVRLTDDWPPGFYLLVAQNPDGTQAAGPGVPLVVRDDAGHEPILMKASTLTWDAYDDWGGWSLYHGPGRPGAAAQADRARAVAVHRPLTGSGYRQLTAMDLPVVRQLEQVASEHGIDVGYTTDVALDADPSRLADHAELVSGGHSEYWTTAMYDGLLAARSAGLNAVFLGANNLWWRARLEGRTATGEPEREVVYREAGEDPDRSAPTVQWQHAVPPRDPAAVLGQSRAGIGVSGGLQLVDPPAWFTAGTSLVPAGVLPGVVGNEADGFTARAQNPPGMQLFGVGRLLGGHGPVLTSISYSTDAAGSAVFAAGSTDWACAPAGSCWDHDVPPDTARVVGVLTRNVLLALSARAAGRTHPATGTPAAVVAAALRRLPAAATGSYGGGNTDEVAPRAG